MAAKFDPERNATLALPALYAKYADKLVATKAELARLNGGKPLAIVPPDWEDCWLVRFLIGFKEDPEMAGKAFFDAHKWREEQGMEAVRLKMVAGLQPQDFPHAAKIRPYLPTTMHGRCRHGLPVEYVFPGSAEPTMLFKSASVEEILVFQRYDAEYKLHIIMTESLERNILVRLQTVFDVKGASVSKHLNRKVTGIAKQVTEQITPRYVEMVDKIQLINCPFAAVVRQVVLYLAPPRAHHKFSIAGGAYHDSVAEHIDPEQWHPCLHQGGPSVHEALGLSLGDLTEDMQLEVVAAGKKASLSVPVPAGTDVNFSIMSEGHDVGLSIVFEPSKGNPVDVFPSARIKGDQRTSGGFPAASEGSGVGGTLKVFLDNSYSWRTKKNVRWSVETLAPPPAGEFGDGV